MLGLARSRPPFPVFEVPQPSPAESTFDRSVTDAPHLADLLVGEAGTVGKLFEVELRHRLFGQRLTLSRRCLSRFLFFLITRPPLPAGSNARRSLPAKVMIGKTAETEPDEQRVQRRPGRIPATDGQDLAIEVKITVGDTVIDKLFFVTLPPVVRRVPRSINSF